MEEEIGDNTDPPRKRGRRRKDDKTLRLPKRRKKPPVQYVRCEIEGCGTVLAHPRYLQHHIKYQHLLKKKYVCNHPSCGRLFRLQKQLLRHAKHHTDQRDYICEFCARAFKSSHNLAVHRMIHTGEKPIQCEICGFTCRQKASLNWHMKKHDADTFYQFSCSICGKKFEKKDCVVAHKAKSHPEVLIAEALAANAGTLITHPTPVVETLAAVASPAQTPVTQETLEGLLHRGVTQLLPVAVPLPTANQIDASQTQVLQLAPRHAMQMGRPRERSTFLQLTAAPTSAAHPHLSSSASQTQLIQLTTLLPDASDAHPTLLTLSSVTALSPSGLLAVGWVREAGGEEQSAGEEVVWERVVGGREQDIGEMVWEGDGERVREDEGMIWERDGVRHMLLESTEVHGDGFI